MVIVVNSPNEEQEDVKLGFEFMKAVSRGHAFSFKYRLYYLIFICRDLAKSHQH